MPNKTVLFCAIALENVGKIRAGQHVSVADIIDGFWALWEDDGDDYQTYDPAYFVKVGA